MALWLVFKYLSSYLSVYWLLFVFTAEKHYFEFQSKLKDWIKRYLIETWHRLFQGCFKSYKIAFRVALWLDFGQLSCYLFVYRRLFRVTISKCYMEFDTNWRIESRDILFKLTTGFLKSILSHIYTFRVALWLDFEQWSSYLFISRCLFRAAISKCYMEFDTNWKIESRDILFELTTGYLKSISSHIE